MSFLRKLLGVGRTKAPPPEEVEHDVAEANARMTNVEVSLRSLRDRLDLVAHREVRP